MKKLYTFCLALVTVSAVAQVPTNFGTNAEDGILYQTYNLIDHGVVSSVRFQAQNSVAEGDAVWEFYTGDYMINWRPYTANDTLSGFDAIIDPSVETASARYNSNYGGQSGRLPAIQAGNYYTCIIQDGTGDNFMSIIETDFQPVAIDTVYISPEQPTVNDDITVTVELDGFNSLSPGEHVFIRASPDFNITSSYLEVTNFSNGVGTAIIPAGGVPAGIPIQYYALVTEEADPEAVADIDYFTLFFANNSGNNYEVTVSTVTGVNEAQSDHTVTVANGFVMLQNVSDVETIQLISVDGRIVRSISVDGRSSLNISTDGLSSGVYVLDLIGSDKRFSQKISIR